MVAKVDDSGARSDKLMLLAAGALAVIALVGFYMSVDAPLLYRVLGLLAGLGIAVFVFTRTGQGRSAIGYIEDSRTEVRKVVWPTRQETTQTTLIVMLIVTLIGLFLWALDGLFGWGFRIVTGIGG